MSEDSKKYIPYHVAIIPDGNRRWAKSRGLKPWEGHEKGAEIIEELSRGALKLGVKCLTFWGSSVDNLTKRPLAEKRALLKIYEKYFIRLIKSQDIYDNETRIRILGRWQEQFPLKLKKILGKGIEKTKKHNNTFLNFLLAYNGDDDMLEAVRKIVKKSKDNDEEISVDNDLIQNNLITSELPEVDLIIRTGSNQDPHNSVGFLMWQTQNSQYYFSDKLFPDFDFDEFKKAIEDFSGRRRSMGE
jgi:tritrans,polycis-undecaprenyl-diphosphate synthase [geranylgeranyl-diphosphate specific]